MRGYDVRARNSWVVQLSHLVRGRISAMEKKITGCSLNRKLLCPSANKLDIILEEKSSRDEFATINYVPLAEDKDWGLCVYQSAIPISDRS